LIDQTVVLDHLQQAMAKLWPEDKLKYGIDPGSLDEVKSVSLEIGNAGLSLFKMIVNK
jgi:hypothetical protein